MYEHQQGNGYVCNKGHREYDDCNSILIESAYFVKIIYYAILIMRIIGSYTTQDCH